MKRKGGAAEFPAPNKKAAGDSRARAQDGHAECDCEELADRRVFKNFSTACEYRSLPNKRCSRPLADTRVVRTGKHYAFPGSHQVGSYGPKGTGIVRTYSNATPGKDIVLDGGELFLYRLKDEAVRTQFLVNAQRLKPVRVFRKVSAGVVDLGLFQVDGFVPAGPGDQVAKFGAEFVRFVRVE
jgi:hypothetical protein